ncbi:MAG TPA: redoxin domain-containing protein [Puia sp.]|nr:redoxin domain-containing protein [Puia sp.]
MGIRLAMLAILITGSAFAQIPAQQLPEFIFHRLDGRAFSNRDLPPGKTVLFVFFDSDCDHCQRAVKSIDQQYRSFQNTLTYFVSLDDHDKINRFFYSYAPHLRDQKNVVVLRDDGNQFITRFKPYRYPAMMLYSADKKLVAYEDNDATVFRIVNALQKGGN